MPTGASGEAARAVGYKHPVDFWLDSMLFMGMTLASRLHLSGSMMMQYVSCGVSSLLGAVSAYSEPGVQLEVWGMRR